MRAMFILLLSLVICVLIFGACDHVILYGCGHSEVIVWGLITIALMCLMLIYYFLIIGIIDRDRSLTI